MYALLKKELKKDITWKEVDIDLAIICTKTNDASFKRSLNDNHDIINRYDRCVKRVEKRLSGPSPKMPNDFDSFLDEMYKAQYYNGLIIVDDFMDCICCPLIYNTKFVLFEKLKAMITGKLEEPKHSIIKEHKVFNIYLLLSGIRVSDLPGTISLSDAHLILNNVDKLNLCPNCIYVVMSMMMYETTTLTEYKTLLFNTKSFMHHRDIRGINKTIFKNFLETNDIKYLKQLEHILCSNAAWYKELKN